MKTVSLSGSLRENVGKKDAKALRNADRVPCVLYGGKEQIHFSVPTDQFRHLVYSPDIAYVDLTIDGKEYKAMLQDMQFHVVSDNIYHADFKELSDEKKITMNVPLKTKGLAPGVAQGGKLVVKMRKLKSVALPNDMPGEITIDISNLGIGQSIKVRDIQIEGVTLLDMPNSIVATISVTRAAAAAARTTGGK
jgi:large subunit ribosomal protein L25